MLIPSLPIETLSHICAYSSPNDLTLLSRTNRTFADLAQRDLYRDLDIASQSRTIQCFKSITSENSTRDLGMLVRRLKLGGKNWPRTAFHSYLVLIMRGMRRMKYLRQLDLNLFGDLSWILQECEFKWLTHFRTKIQCDTRLMDWLSRHPLITILWLSPCAPSDPHALKMLPPSSLPRLSSLVAPLNIAAVLVPGRPVTTLILDVERITEEDGLLDRCVPSLALSSQSIRDLRIMTWDLGSANPQTVVDFCVTIACHLPNVAQLSLCTVPWGEMPLVQFTSVLKQLKLLSSVTIFFGTSKSMLPKQAELDLLYLWRTACPSLESGRFLPGGRYQHEKGSWTAITKVTT